jgi:glycerophosphoryl diester phosphodiesterase
MSVHPLIIGHRGASAEAPENTMAAFQKAIAVGADGIEFDVRLSKDGVPVIIHDETLRRTTGRPESVSNLSAEELRTIDVGNWFSSEFKGEGVPTLEQLLDHFSDNDALLYLELKCAPAEVAGIAHTVCGMVAGNPISDRVIVECFDLSAIAEVKRRAPKIKTAALFEPKVSDPASLIPGATLVERAKCVGADEIALHHRVARRRTVEQARNAGLKVVVWTVDDPSWLSKGREYGIDCLITNDPALMLRHRNPTDAI